MLDGHPIAHIVGFHHAPVNAILLDVLAVIGSVGYPAFDNGVGAFYVIPNPNLELEQALSWFCWKYDTKVKFGFILDRIDALADNYEDFVDPYDFDLVKRWVEFAKANTVFIPDAQGVERSIPTHEV